MQVCRKGIPARAVIILRKQTKINYRMGDDNQSIGADTIIDFMC